MGDPPNEGTCWNTLRVRNQEARSPSEIPKQKITDYVVDDVAVVAFAPRDA